MVKLSKYLVIVESPTKVKTLSKFLDDTYQVEACGGHIRDLPRSKMGVDIEKRFEPHYVNISKKKKIISLLKKEAKDKEILYLACDPDREGEAIAWHITKIMDSKAKIYRVVFNELTKDVVLAAFENPSEIDMNKVNAQQARRILDRIVGYELSPLLWKKVVRGLSAGRVQSVAVRLIVKRENDIQAFVAQEYWEIEAQLKKKKSKDSFTPLEKGIADENHAIFEINTDGEDSLMGFTAKLDKIKDKKPEINDKEQAESICHELKKETFIVSDIKNSVQKRYPKPPFITSTLQQAGFNKLGFTASKTMHIAQELYEGIDLKDGDNVGLISYMRTDSVSVSEVALKEARSFIETEFGKEYLPLEVKRYKSKKYAQGAHEAIRPTSVKHTPYKLKDSLTKEQYKLYKIIWDQFVASCMKEAEISLTAISIKAGDYLFKVSGSEVLFEGFTVIFKEVSEEKKTKLPPLFKDEELNLLKLIPSQHFTQPPPRFTDASLIRTLEEEGIGRPSTYAPTIRTIIWRYYVRREKRYLIPTELGTVVNELLVENFPNILDIKFTAKMEEELDKIEQGEIDWRNVLEEFYQPFIKNVNLAKVKMRNVKQEVIPTDKICEKCQRPMVIKWSRHGKFLSCSGFPECKNAKSLDTGIKCPSENCDGALVQRRSKAGRTFYGCSRYPECKFVTNKLPEADIEGT